MWLQAAALCLAFLGAYGGGVVPVAVSYQNRVDGVGAWGKGHGNVVAYAPVYNNWNSGWGHGKGYSTHWNPLWNVGHNWGGYGYEGLGWNGHGVWNPWRWNGWNGWNGLNGWKNGWNGYGIWGNIDHSGWDNVHHGGWSSGLHGGWGKGYGGWGKGYGGWGNGHHGGWGKGYGGWGLDGWGKGYNSWAGYPYGSWGNSKTYWGNAWGGHGGYGSYGKGYGIPSYKYSYGVASPHTGDYKQVHEVRLGDVVKGGYALADPNGGIREVKYMADGYNGFNAKTSQVMVHDPPHKGAYNNYYG